MERALLSVAFDFDSCRIFGGSYPALIWSEIPRRCHSDRIRSQRRRSGATVIAATPQQLHTLIQGLSSGEYYADLDAALGAFKRESMFNVIDLRTGWKIDMIICKSRAFSQAEFGRRQRLSLHGISLSVASAEDVILSKLEWSKLSQSQRQTEDAAGILKIQRSWLNRPHLEQWIHELGLEKEWEDALRAANISDLSISPE
jgi:hypothetical protein